MVTVFFNCKGIKSYIPLAVRMMISSHVIAPLTSEGMGMEKTNFILFIIMEIILTLKKSQRYSKGLKPHFKNSCSKQFSP